MTINTTYYLSKEEPVRSCLLALRSLILDQHPKLVETRKYGMPCFCYGKKIFCYLWTDKKTHQPYILMVDGKRLTHPKLEQGLRSRMKILRIDPNKNLPVRMIHAVLREALALHDD